MSILLSEMKSSKASGLLRSLVTEATERVFRWARFKEETGPGLRFMSPAKRIKDKGKGEIYG